ncbi:hypothetical protein OESDEN_03441 [Oesophagostomum dentatum]|uniref:Major facilitator superfamily (MFS) profile domain-containing protein n=1 Tax=Oesophagostomum dentatum TaxID=61180 RepID=A0A0B1TH74_OESDE|nr:hypothetical protein OESDEN_03441 [Oesophagostomum dentatum]
MQLPSAYVVRRFPTDHTLLIVILVHSFMNALIPVLAVNVGTTGVFACRLCIGIAHCFVDVLINTLINSWFPYFERSTALAIFAIGIIGFMFSILWFCFGSASPDKCKRITKLELLFLSEGEGRNNKKKKSRAPLLAMVKSFPVWAEFQMQMVICVASTISQSYLPTFYKERVLISAVMVSR